MTNIMRDMASILTLLVYFAGDHDQCMKYKNISSVNHLHKLHFMVQNFSWFTVSWVMIWESVSWALLWINHIGWSHEWLTSGLGTFKWSNIIIETVSIQHESCQYRTVFNMLRLTIYCEGGQHAEVVNTQRYSTHRGSQLLEVDK